MLQHLIIPFPLYILSSGRLQEIKNTEKVQTFSSESSSKYIVTGKLVVN